MQLHKDKSERYTLLAQRLTLTLVIVASLLTGYWLAFAEYQPLAELGKVLSTLMGNPL